MAEYYERRITMRLDLDCIHSILVSLADNLQPDEYGDISPINPLDFYQEELSQYSQNEALYWIRQLMDSNIIIAGKKYVSEPLPQIKDLSIVGYQFIESAGSESVWNKIKPKLLQLSLDSLATLVQKCIELGFSFIG